MKNLAKTLLIALSLTLVFGVMAFTASASEELTPEIIAKNIEYTDKTAIQFAVDPATVDTADVKLVVTRPDSSEFTVTKYEVAPYAINGVNGALIFTIEGLPASAICDTVTVVVKSGDNESAPYTYSVAEYFYERLYSDGIVNAAEGKDAARKEFYETYLANAAAAQKLFRNFDENGNPSENPIPLVTEYNVLAVKDGVLANGKEVMLSTETITSAVYANDTLAANKFFTNKWTVTTYGETNTTATVANGAEVTSSGCVSVTPVYTDATGEYFLSDEKGTRWDYDTLSSIDASSVSQASGSITIKDGSMYFEDGAAESVAMYAKFYNGTVAGCTIFEFDFKLKTSWGSYPIQIKVANLQYTIYNEGGLKIEANGTKVPLGIGFNEWGTLRFEHYYSQKVVKVFVNNKFLVDINTTSEGSTKQSSIIYLTSNERGKESDADLWIDNVYAGNIDKAFVAGDPKASN